MRRAAVLLIGMSLIGTPLMAEETFDPSDPLDGYVVIPVRPNEPPTDGFLYTPMRADGWTPWDEDTPTASVPSTSGRPIGTPLDVPMPEPRPK
jgi:hypothetical protein